MKDKTQEEAVPNGAVPADDQHTPLLAMWYQTRTALADITIPLLAGLKAVWLIAFSPTKFFLAYFDEAKSLTKMRTPFDVAWRALTPEERMPLDAAKFLFFGILTAAFAGFGFDNSARMQQTLANSRLLGGQLDNSAQVIPGLGEAVDRLQAIAANPTVVEIQAFFDGDIVAAIMELIVTLFITMLFAYLFSLMAGHEISATSSYSFWLYMTGMGFFMTAITFMILKIFALPVVGLADFVEGDFSLVVENAWLFLWLFLVPLLFLPHIFSGLTRRRTLKALVITHAVFIVVSWLFRAGFTSLLLLWSSFSGRF